MALSHIGAKNTIESLTENSAEAAACATWYDVALETTLEMNDWTFARKRVALSLDSEEAPESEWSYRYVLPADCIVPRRLEFPEALLAEPGNYLFSGVDTAQKPLIPYDLELSDDGERKTLLTNLEDAVLVYTSYITNTVLFSSSFKLTLSYQLAHFIAVQLTGKAKLKEDLWQYARASLNMAGASDGNANVDRKPPDAPWISGRN